MCRNGLRGLVYIAILFLFSTWLTNQPSTSQERLESPGTYFFCFWNVENFFDDERDNYLEDPDHSYDIWFADNPSVRRQKLDNLASVILAMNEGRGPDILALAEVESERAGELLMQTLNRRIPNPSLHYSHLLYRDPRGNRAIAPTFISRVPVVADRTRLLGNRLRILQAHFRIENQELVVVASHWSSRISDKTGEMRARYADQIYGSYRAMTIANPQVDFLVCGDFNDDPEDNSVRQNLHATGDLAKVVPGVSPPVLGNLAEKWREAGKGTLYYMNRPNVFDQFCVSPGLLDRNGWSCEVNSAHIASEKMSDHKGHPHRFGSARDTTPLEKRGYADHFPITITLRVKPTK